MIEILVIALIYIVGIFAALALITYVWNDSFCLDGNEDLVVIFSTLSWLFVALVLLIFITSKVWSYTVKHPFVLYPFIWFYNKCKERFKSERA
jgi:hypothetical protein